MRIKYTVLSLLVVLSSPVQALELDFKRDMAGALIVTDWLQTLEIAKNPDKYEEVNIDKIIGKHPSRSSVNYFFASQLLLHYVLNRNLKGGLRDTYNMSMIGGRAYVVIKNHSVGLKINFKFN